MTITKDQLYQLTLQKTIELTQNKKPNPREMSVCIKQHINVTITADSLRRMPNNKKMRLTTATILSEFTGVPIDQLDCIYNETPKRPSPPRDRFDNRLAMQFITRPHTHG